MKLPLIIITLLAGIFAASGEAPDAHRQDEIVSQINKAAAGLKTMSCSFTQTKHLSMLSDKMTSHGKMYYKQPDCLRWVYTSPYRYLFLFNGTKVYVGSDRKRDVIDTNSNKVFKEVARIMMSTVTGKALTDKADFTVAVEENASGYTVTLEPRKRDLRQMFARVVLSFSARDMMVTGISIHEKNGDSTDIKFSDVKYNGTVDETLFDIPR